MSASNLLEAKNVLCFYNSNREYEVAGAAFIQECKSTASTVLVDVYGSDETAVNALVAAAIASPNPTSYDYVFILCDTQAASAGGTSKVSEPNLSTLYTALKSTSAGTSVATGTAQAGGGLQITLAAADAAGTNAYASYYIVITGGTDSGDKRYIRSNDTATKVAVTAKAWTATPDGTSTYAIYNASAYMCLYFAADASGNLTHDRAWNKIHPSCSQPYLTNLFSGYLRFLNSGTAQSGSAGAYTAVIAAAATTGDRFYALHATNDTYNNKYLYTGAGTAKKYYSLITDYVGGTNTVTLQTVIPTGGFSNDSVYRIIDDLNEVYYDMWARLAIRAMYRDLTDADTITAWKEIINYNDQADYEYCQNQDTLDAATAVLEQGEAIHTAFYRGMSAL